MGALAREGGRSARVNGNVTYKPVLRVTSTAVVRGSRGPRAVLKLHLCVRRSGVLGCRNENFACEVQYSMNPALSCSVLCAAHARARSRSTFARNIYALSRTASGQAGGHDAYDVVSWDRWSECRKYLRRRAPSVDGRTTRGWGVLDRRQRRCQTGGASQRSAICGDCGCGDWHCQGLWFRQH